MNWCELAQTYFDAAMMARYTAQGYRRSAKQWPKHASEDTARATACYERAIGYLRDVRHFQANADARKVEDHGRLAA